MDTYHDLDIPGDVFAAADHQCARYIAIIAFWLTSTAEPGNDVDGDVQCAILDIAFERYVARFSHSMSRGDAVSFAGALVIRIHQRAQQFARMAGGAA